MTKRSSLQLLLRWSWLFHRKRTVTGFTLIELLVAVLIGGIISGALLYGVVEILQTNQRESSRAETQREMQLALDYISADLRKAVFVYDGNCLTGSGTIPTSGVACPGVVSALPSAVTNVINNPPSTRPILAFWRVDDLPQKLIDLCTANLANLNSSSNPNPPTGINGVPCLSRRTYTLVVYYLDITNSNKTWQGNARIKRYELTQFDTNGNPNKGWGDPTITLNRFIGWPFATNPDTGLSASLRDSAKLPDGSANMYSAATAKTPNPPVLVDFVDNPISIVNNTSTCPAEATGSSLPTFFRTPTNTTGGSGSTSFYACVRGGGVTPASTVGGVTTPAKVSNTEGRNQEVAVFLRGNAAGRGGIPLSGRSPFEMQTRVLVRGSYEKNPF